MLGQGALIAWSSLGLRRAPALSPPIVAPFSFADSLPQRAFRVLSEYPRNRSATFAGPNRQRRTKRDDTNLQSSRPRETSLSVTKKTSRLNLESGAWPPGGHAIHGFKLRWQCQRSRATSQPGNGAMPEALFCAPVRLCAATTAAVSKDPC